MKLGGKYFLPHRKHYGKKIKKSMIRGNGFSCYGCYIRESALYTMQDEIVHRISFANWRRMFQLKE